MEKEFCTYKQALSLKELGFDEPCLSSWTYKTKERIPTLYGCGALLFDTDGLITNQTEDIICSAPLYQQAFRWFREKYSLYHNVWNYTHGEPTDLVPNGFTYSIDEEWITIIGKKEDGYFEKYYTTYEEAEQACLDKLIEIVKG
jgi:hypothetical protein